MKDIFLALGPSGRKEVQKQICARALEVWRAFAIETVSLAYVDSVVGMRHEVDFQLPADAYQAAFLGRSFDLAEIDQRYLEPLSALQDGDLNLPGNAEMAFYALYNAFRRYHSTLPVDDWLIVIQALASLPEPEQRPTMLESLGIRE